MNRPHRRDSLMDNPLMAGLASLAMFTLFLAVAALAKYLGS